MAQSDKPYFKSSSKTTKVTCRVLACKREILKQSYPRHLSDCHPNEDPRDLRTFEERSISIKKFVGGSEKAKGGGRELDVVEGEGQDQDVEEDDGREQHDVQHYDEIENPIGGDSRNDRDLEMEVEIHQALIQDEKNLELGLSKSLQKQIEDLAQQVGNVDVSDCAGSEEAASKQLIALKVFLDVGREVKLLEDLTKRFKGALGIKEELSKSDVNVDNLIKEARSLKAITEKVPQFEYEDMKDGGKLVCRVCDVSFKYSRNLESDFTQEKKLGLEFKNLKGTLREHLRSKRHEKAETELMSKELLQSKEERRNTAVGLRCGKLVYYLIKKGRPFDDYTTLIHLNAANGADMGELNHSHSFVLKFLPSLADEVRRRWEAFLSKPMAATGCR